MQKGAAEQILAGPMFWTSKAAILLLYIRLFGTMRWVRNVSYALLAFTFCFTMYNTVISFIWCFPSVGEPWGPAVSKKCFKATPNAIALGVIGLVTDIIMFALPFPILGKLQLGRQRRIALIVVFSVGFL